MINYNNTSTEDGDVNIINENTPREMGAKKLISNKREWKQNLVIKGSY